jgi:hypothetical protein
MSGIDAFAAQLLEEAKWHLESARSAGSAETKAAFCHAALLVGVSALEAHLNALCDELSLRKSLSVLERSLLLERDYSLSKGEFALTNKLKMYRLLERLEFVFVRFTKAATPPSDAWWTQVQEAISLRNDIVHPKKAASVSESAVERALTAILACLNALYLGVFRKKHPAFGRGLDSHLGT